MDDHVCDIVGIGAACWDHYLVVPRYPEPNDKVRAIKRDECAGGTMANALVVLQRWGLRCRFVGMLGFDDFSNRILADLDHEGVRTDKVVRREDADGRRATVLVDNRTGSRSIISGPHRVPAIEPADLPAGLFKGARILHLDTTVDECAVEAAIAAKAEGLTVVLDAERIGKRTADILRHCDYIIANRAFALEYTQQETTALAAYALYLQSGKPVVVTDGENGCEYASERVSFSQHAFEVPVVDSTAAGDVFHAAFIYGLLLAWSPQRIVRFASWAGAMTCREIGGRKGIPTISAVREFTLHEHD